MDKLQYREHAKKLFAPTVGVIEGVLLKTGGAILEEMHAQLAERDEKIERLEQTVGTLISYLHRELGTQAAQELITKLHHTTLPPIEGEGRCAKIS